MIGTTVGNFQVTERLGEGGMGTVYRAIDQMLDREVALKVMRPEISRQAGLTDRFRQEAVALARLNHPRIAAVYGLERHGDDLVMVMEFVRGETLEAIVHRSGRLAWARAFELGAEVLEALGHAHLKGVVHRDIKPANVMLGRDGHVKVMDFGIARIMGRSRQTRTGAAVGTPVYMSPEQLRGQEVDGRSDLYSLAAVLFELVTGQLPFDAGSDYELMMKQLNEPAPPVRDTVPDAPAVVDELLQRAMAKSPDDRFPDAGAMAAALRAAIASHATRAAPARPAPPTRLGDAASVTPMSDRGVELPATRLADAVAPTRLADATTPATRLAATGEAVRPVAAAPDRQWFTDWRPWSAVAAVALLAAIALRGDRTPPAPADPPRNVADTVRDVPREPSTPPVRPPSTAGSLGGASPAPVSSSVAPVVPTTVAGTAPVAGEPPAGPPATPPASRRERPTPPTRTRTPDKPPAASPAPRTEVVPAPAEVRPAEPPAPDRNAAGAIADALADFSAAVNRGETARVDGVLRGDAAGPWLTLMREGRIAMAVTGAPEVDADGGRATARFGAVLSVRSAFGANRKRSAQFVADLARAGGGWRVTALRPVGRLSLD